MSIKAIFGFLSGIFFGIILFIIVAAFVAYVFGPNYFPKSPCLIDSNCKVQKVCCADVCTSVNLSWWKCPSKLCEIVGKRKLSGNCGCHNFRCSFS